MDNVNFDIDNATVDDDNGIFGWYDKHETKVVTWKTNLRINDNAINFVVFLK